MLNLIKACQSLDVANTVGTNSNSQEQNEIPGQDINGPMQDGNPANPLDALVGTKMNAWTMVSGILPGRSFYIKYNEKDLFNCT